MTSLGANLGAVGGAGPLRGVDDVSCAGEVTPAAARTYGNLDLSVLFESLSSSPPANLPLPVPLVPSNPEGAVAGAAARLLSMGDMEVGGDISALMALLYETAQKQRSAARELRNAEMQQQVSDLLDAAQQIRDSAQKQLTGAIIAGAFQIVGGAIQTIAGGYHGYGAYKGADAAALNKAETYSVFAKATDGLFRGVGETAQATQKAQAAGMDADKAELEAAARVHDNSAQQAQDQSQLMLEIMRDIRDKLSAMDQARLETNRGIARNL